MITNHEIVNTNSSSMLNLDDKSVHLVVTSPPYPMIQMWDTLFFQLSPKCATQFEQQKYYQCCQTMNDYLTQCWTECYRILCDGGILCINIGDAYRNLSSNFYHFPNAALTVAQILPLGFQSLPPIIWYKPSNKPNKFMGSGMLPPTAYVTMEHEYILLFRKGCKRQIKDKDKRHKSSYFWEERNQWFQNVWSDIKGVKQAFCNSSRQRSAAYALDVPLRLINMFSLYEDVVVDPFVGTGTTTFAAALSGRNSIGYEIDTELTQNIFQGFNSSLVKTSSEYTKTRLQQHHNFIKCRQADNKQIKHFNTNHNTPVITSQEKKIQLYTIDKLQCADNNCGVSHTPFIYVDEK